MATVDLAEDTRLGRHVALKRMGGTVDVSGISRLRREALAGASLNHPNIVSVYDILTLEDGDVVIVMEYVDGETLRERLTRRGALPAAEAMPILAGAAAGLDAIHKAGIVHRDVKPSNILLGDDGAVKIADLGVASVPDRTRITTSGSIIGSLSYMAPEQLEDGPITPAIDIYAFSAVAYEVLSGVKARDAPNPVALAHTIATKSPPSLREAWPAAPQAAADLVRRGMAREPRARPASAGELVGGLDRALAERPKPRPRATPAPAVAPPRTGRPGPRRAERPAPLPIEPRRASTGHDERRRWGLAALALGLVCVAIALVVLLNQGSSSTPKKAASSTKSHSHRSGSRTSTRHASTSKAPQTSSSASGSATATSSASSGAGSATSTPGSTTPAGPAGAAGPQSAPTAASAGSPVGTVESFYRLAAAHQYPQAWALADPAFRSQLGGYRSFQAGQANDRSITFHSAKVTSQSPTATTVAVSTTSVQSSGTHNCSGTVDLVPGGAGHWLLHQIHINCS